MAWREKLYERQLKRPVDSGDTQGDPRRVRAAAARDPGAARSCSDHPSKPEMTIKTRWLSFIVQFNKETLTGRRRALAGRQDARHPENRQVAVEFIDSIANDLNL